MEQVRALNALEPYLALSKSANSPRAATDLITQATSAQNTYVFAELLQTPNIQALRDSPEYAQYLRLLEIFAWGTWADYTSTPNLPQLSPAQQLKLRHLSLLPLSTTTNHSYSTLQAALSLPSVRDLENLVISAIYASLISATLDPRAQTVCISSISPLRDLPPASIPNMLSELSEWGGRCDSVLAGLENQIARVKSRAHKRAQDDARREKTMDSIKDKVAKDFKGSGGGGGSGAGFGAGGERMAMGVGRGGGMGILGMNG